LLILELEFSQIIAKSQ